RHRYPRHRPAVAAAPLPRALDQALRPAHRRAPARQRRDQSPSHANGRRQSALGRAANPRRAPQARPRRGRAHRLPADGDAALAAVAVVANHVPDLVSIDFFAVPSARLRVLFVLVVLAHHRRRVLHFNVTEHPTAAWAAQQIVETFPEDSAPSYLLRDRDTVYGHPFRQRVKGMRISEVLTAPQSPWQN